MRDDGDCPSVSGGPPVGGAVVTLVGQNGPTSAVRPQIHQQRHMRSVGPLTAGQIAGEDLTFEIRLEVDLGREAPARAAKGLPFLPPFAPAAET